MALGSLFWLLAGVGAGALATWMSDRRVFVGDGPLQGRVARGERVEKAVIGFMDVSETPLTGAQLPGALIGFAGARVIEQTIREKLPKGFQRSEYLYEHGMVDMVVHRHNLRPTIGSLSAILTKVDASDALTSAAPSPARTSLRDAAVAAEGDDGDLAPVSAAHAE